MKSTGKIIDLFKKTSPTKKKTNLSSSSYYDEYYFDELLKPELSENEWRIFKEEIIKVVLLHFDTKKLLELQTLRSNFYNKIIPELEIKRMKIYNESKGNIIRGFFTDYG